MPRSRLGMWYHVRRCLAEHAANGRRADLSGGRVVCLDDSKGRTQGSILLLFPDGSDVPSMVAKCAPLGEARLREGRFVYQIDYENLAQLEQVGMSDSERLTPEPHGMWIRDGVLVTLQSALPGELLKNLPGRDVLSARTAPATIGRVVEWWRRFQQRFGVRHRSVDAATYQEEILGRLDRFASRFVLSSDERRFLDRRFRDETRLLGQRLPFMARHGDFCPANVILGPPGASVFDWELPVRHHLPLFDVFHFFAATRFPFTGMRRESRHFESFQHVFWGRNYLNDLLSRTLEEACNEFEIPRESVGDLFILSLIEIANLKYDGLLEINRCDELPEDTQAPTDDEKRRRWQSLGGIEKDVPFARITDCVVENTRFVVRHGVPACCSPSSAV